MKKPVEVKDWKPYLDNRCLVKVDTLLYTPVIEVIIKEVSPMGYVKLFDVVTQTSSWYSPDGYLLVEDLGVEKE